MSACGISGPLYGKRSQHQRRSPGLRSLNPDPHLHPRIQARYARADEALKQINGKSYAGKYAAALRLNVLLGINFSSEQKMMDDWEMVPPSSQGHEVADP